MLIERNASVDLADEDGWTALHLASRNGQLEVARLLIERNASIDLATKDGATALHLALRNGHLEVARLLIECNASIDLGDEDGWTALHLALRNGTEREHQCSDIQFKVCLYSNASDFALGASLQQIQPVQIKDLQGPAIYKRLRGAWDANLPVPRLFVNLVKDVTEGGKDEWAKDFDDTVVHVERVIAYWSRTLRPAERN
ncbi:ankyrin repeat-containing domain protein [Mycena olivaceomarginata]|nr:ankyrin repeat-containing domain protein [Mycena olivaceomarginata]